VSTQDPAVTTAFHVPEYRGQQDVTVRQSLRKIELHRISIEKTDCNVSKLMLEEELRFTYDLGTAFRDFFGKRMDQYLKGIVYTMK
jgi:hypothetical protein